MLLFTGGLPHFTVTMDHKPLEGILKKKICLKCRIQGWSSCVRNYCQSNLFWNGWQGEAIKLLMHCPVLMWPHLQSQMLSVDLLSLIAKLKHCTNISFATPVALKFLPRGYKTHEKRLWIYWAKFKALLRWRRFERTSGLSSDTNLMAPLLSVSFALAASAGFLWVPAWPRTWALTETSFHMFR